MIYDTCMLSVTKEIFNCGDIKFVFFATKKNNVKVHTRNRFHSDTLFDLANYLFLYQPTSPDNGMYFRFQDETRKYFHKVM